MPLIVPQVVGQGTTLNSYQLTLDGNDLIRQPGTAPTLGTPMDSIVLVEAGPGAVSSLRFRYEDPGTTGPLPITGSEVRFFDITGGFPLFWGTVTAWNASPWGGVGRAVDVECDGIEKVLDSIVPTFTTGFNVNLQGTIQNMAGVIGLRVGNTALGSTPEGTRATPVGQLGAGVALPYSDYITTVTGTTFREAVKQVSAAALVHPIGVAAYVPAPPNLTVDVYGGLRVWDQDAQPDDWTTLTVTDTPASILAATNLQYEVHPGDVVHEVYILGANAAATGWFGDGTGIVGQQAYVNDASLDTHDKSLNAATSYMAAQAATVRGTFGLDTVYPASTIHAGGLLSLTDARVGVAATYIIQTITRRFRTGSGVQDWTVDFGGRRPSAMQELRNLTRTTLN